MQLMWSEVPDSFLKALLCRGRTLALLTLIMIVSRSGAGPDKIVLSRDDATVVLEPYAPNIMRVTLSLRKDDAVAGPGYGIVAHAASGDWSQTHDQRRRLQIFAHGGHRRPGGHWTPTGTAADIAKFFNGSTPGVGISFKTPDGKTLLDMQGWQMSVPNYKDGNAAILYDRRPTDPPFFQVGATFHSPSDEHYYGLGQNQEGFLDRRGHVARVRARLQRPGRPKRLCPFRRYELRLRAAVGQSIEDHVAFGFNDQTRWTSEVGQRVSFFVIAGNTYDEIYAGYRLLTGDTPMLPKSAYGYIQCKQRYTSQQEVLDVAKGYRDRHLPQTSSSSTGSTTRRWARWTWTPRSGPIPLR